MREQPTDGRHRRPNRCGTAGEAILRQTRAFSRSSAAGLNRAQVPNLKLKWAFGLPLADEAHSQPTVAGERVFVGSDAGTVYSLDAGDRLRLLVVSNRRRHAEWHQHRAC